jgi:hypothetical protein
MTKNEQSPQFVLFLFSWQMAVWHQHGGAPKEGKGCQAAGLQSTLPTNLNLKTTDFLDMVMSNILHDLHFSQNQTLKSSDD